MVHIVSLLKHINVRYFIVVLYKKFKRTLIKRDWRKEHDTVARSNYKSITLQTNGVHASKIK